jgi:hypothetical protein
MPNLAALGHTPMGRGKNAQSTLVVCHFPLRNFRDESVKMILSR